MFSRIHTYVIFKLFNSHRDVSTAHSESALPMNRIGTHKLDICLAIVQTVSLVQLELLRNGSASMPSTSSAWRSPFLQMLSPFATTSFSFLLNWWVKLLSLLYLFVFSGYSFFFFIYFPPLFMFPLYIYQLPIHAFCPLFYWVSTLFSLQMYRTFLYCQGTTLSNRNILWATYVIKIFLIATFKK